MKHKKYLVVANWKMNLTLSKSVFLIKQCKKLKLNNVELVIAPSYPVLPAANKLLKRSKIKIGAQNCAEKDFGALTGEVSPAMLVELGCSYVILGHSERKNFFKEDFIMVNRKIKTAVQYGLIPIVCVGEDWNEKQEGRTAAVVAKQISEALQGVDPQKDEVIVVSYEPFWTISTSRGSRAATTKEVEESCQMIRHVLIEIYGIDKFNKNFKVIYGGTVNEQTIEFFSRIDILEGFLVGGASLDCYGFQKLINEI
ncbi:MAG: triose-phosphate isomerase [Patescibacteria group bacterium]